MDKELLLLRVAKDIVLDIHLSVVNEEDCPAKALLSIAATALSEVVNVFNLQDKALRNG